MIYLRNEPYDFEAVKLKGRPSEVVAASVLYNDRLWTGERHWTLINQIVEDLQINKGTDESAIDKDGNLIYVSQDKQGFLCDTGLHVSREAAKGICMKNGQLSKDFDKSRLLSEYLW